MENLLPIVVVCVVSAILLAIIDVILVPRLGCRKIDLVPGVLRSLVLFAGLLILQPQTRNHPSLYFCFALAFDYFYSRMFRS